MNQEFKTTNIDNYVQSLNARSVRKRFSFRKVVFAIILGVLVILSVFKGENAITFLFGYDNSKKDPLPSGEYFCDENESFFANGIKPAGVEADYVNENENLRIEKEELDKRRNDATSELADIKWMPEGLEKKKREEALSDKLNQYNKDVENFNNRFDDYKRRLTSFNERVRVYNEYLEDNCRD